jgi:hypothetical protein
MRAPSQEDLYRGAGEVLLSRFDDLGVPTGFEHLGNIDTFELTTADDKITKRSSMTIARPIRSERTRQRTVTIRLVGDEFNAYNMALMAMGEVVDYTQLATPIVKEQLVAAAAAGVSVGAQKGKIYKASKFDANTITLFSNVSTSLTLGLDWEVHSAKMGTVRIFANSPNVVVGGSLEMSYTPTAVTAAAPYKRVRGGTKSQVRGSLLFVPDTSEGPAEAIQVWSTSLTPDGALAMIPDEWGGFTLVATVQEDVKGQYGGSVLEPLYALTDLRAAA